MSKHSPDDIGYKQMFLINKFEKDIMENSLSKMRELKNISNGSSNPIKNISKSSQTEEVINESKDDVNLIERKNKDENKMISSDQTKGNDLSEKGLTDVHNEGNNRITSEDQTKKRKTPNKNKKILNIKKKLESGFPSVPSTIKDELNCNIFLRAKNQEEFSKLRDLKDNF